MNKGFEKKRKIREHEVTKKAFEELKIDALLATIAEWEEKLETQKTGEVVNHLIALYNKAIEYYGALQDDKHSLYLGKLKTLFTDESLMQAVASEKASADPQSDTASSQSSLNGSVATEETKE